MSDCWERLNQFSRTADLHESFSLHIPVACGYVFVWDCLVHSSLGGNPKRYELDWSPAFENLVLEMKACLVPFRIDL
jgi:hypothetical protein